MYPSQNPPPPVEVRNQSAYPFDISPFWTASMAGGSCTRFQALALYCLCAALLGMAIGLLGVALHHGFHWLEWKHGGLAFAQDAPPRVAMLDLAWVEPELRTEDIIGYSICLFFAGIPAGYFLWLMVMLWRPFGHPIRAAALCVSLGGSLGLLTMASHLLEQRDNSREFLMTIVTIGIVTLLCGLFGYVHGLVVGRVMQGLKSWQSEPNQVPASSNGGLVA